MKTPNQTDSTEKAVASPCLGYLGLLTVRNNMPIEKRARNLFKALGSSPYMLALLKFIAAANPNYSDIEGYFRGVRRLHGYTEGLPTSKVIAYSLRTLADYELVEKSGGRWSATKRAKPLLEFERNVEERGEERTYVWRTATIQSKANCTKELAHFLADFHEFQNITSLDPDSSLDLQALVRPNPGYDEAVVLQESGYAVCGLMYSLEDARLSKIMQHAAYLRAIEEHGGLREMIYNHLAARLQHSVADLEHACFSTGSLIQWENQVGMADYKLHELRSLDLLTQRYSQIHPQAFGPLGTLRALDLVRRNMSDTDVKKGLVFLSEGILALEQELCKVEFNERPNEVLSRSLEVIRDELAGEKHPAKAVSEAVATVRRYVENDPENSQRLVPVLRTIEIRKPGLVFGKSN